MSVRLFAGGWLLMSLVIVNLPSVPSLSAMLVFLVLTSLFALFVPFARSWIAGMFMSFMTLGLLVQQLASHQLAPDQISTDMRLTVRVISVPAQDGQRLSFMARIKACDSCTQDLRVKRIKLSWYGQYAAVRAGETWQLTVKLKPPATLRNTGGFDSVAFNLIKGIHAKGYVKAGEQARRLSGSSGFSLARLRQEAAERLQRLVANDHYLGLLQGLTVGMKTQISDHQWDVLRGTGTAHLLAISGLHVGLVAAWVLVAGRLVSRMLLSVMQRFTDMTLAFDSRSWTLAASLAAAVAYAGLAGFELPTQRAVLMLCVWIIAALRFRFLPPLSALCVALVAVLSINALNILSAGFWLSFGTVGALFYIHRGHLRVQRTGSLVKVSSAIQRVRALGTTHVLLGIVLLPVSAWFFQSGSVVAPLANLVAVPWVAMVSVPLSLAGLVVSAVSDTVALPLLTLATLSLQLLIRFLSVLNASFLSSVVVTLPGIPALVLVLLGLVVMLAPKGLRLRLLAVPLFLPALMHNVSVPVSDGFQVHVLDVGQGLAVLVFAGNQTLLFDTGGKLSPELSMFEAVVVPYLQAAGRRRVDTLVVSHGDEDHAFGVSDVIKRYPGVQIHAGQKLNLPQSHTVSPCVAGDYWSHGAVHFGFLHPGIADRGSDNNRSCVLMIYSGVSRVLLTGDIEATAEQTLLSRLRLPAEGYLLSVDDDGAFPVTLLTAPHHGSKSSSTQAFVDTLRPQYVVFPAGQGNRFGFPHRDVQLRYKLAGSETFVTGTSGAVSFSFGPEGLSRPPTSWWMSHRRFWHGIVNTDCWQHFADQSLLLRLHALSQKGQTLCGK